MAVLSIGHAVLKVRNVEAAEAFYHGVLGFPIATRWDGLGVPMTFFTLGQHHDLAVVAVNFLVNNVVVFTDSSAPYEYALAQARAAQAQDQANVEKAQREATLRSSVAQITLPLPQPLPTSMPQLYAAGARGSSIRRLT